MAGGCSHFDERSGIVPFATPWGRWWQTTGEVCIEVTSLDCDGEERRRVTARDIVVDVTPNHIGCRVHGKTIFEGKLRGTVVADETVWTVVDEGDQKEPKRMLHIQLTKAGASLSEGGNVWTSLLLDGHQRFAPDPWTLNEMHKKIDLEKFQIENPGFDFSNASLSKTYD